MYCLVDTLLRFSFSLVPICFSRMNVSPPFNLCVCHPNIPLSLPEMESSPIAEYQDTLIMVITCEADNNEILEELKYLTDPEVVSGVKLLLSFFMLKTCQITRLQSSNKKIYL